MTDQQTAQPRSPPAGPPLLATRNLTRHFRLGGGLVARHTLHAVDDLTITIGEREIVALAGGSGSGSGSPRRWPCGPNSSCGPAHPYTQLLLSAVPDPQAHIAAGATSDHGEPPKVIDPVPGCRFRWRCPLAIEECHHTTPHHRCGNSCQPTAPPATWPRRRYLSCSLIGW